MCNTNENLFKQALLEGLNNRIQREIEACDEYIIVSSKHQKFMEKLLKYEQHKIMYNKLLEKRSTIVAYNSSLMNYTVLYGNEYEERICLKDVR